MVKARQGIMLLFAMWIAISGLFLQPQQTNAATTDYVTVTKSANPSAITTLDEVDVQLSITGTPPVNVTVPNDVVLVIDKSGSMAPSYNNGEDKMKNAKEAAKGFVDLMDLSVHRVAVVDFSSTNMIGSLDFTTDKQQAKNYIDTISANGSTATGDAIDVARGLLANHRPEAQPVIVIMTDGDATQPSTDPYQYAKDKAMQAKAEGIIFYTIALLKSTDNPDTSGPNILLKDMATTANHHHFVLGSTGLSEIYAAIVKEIGLASAYDVKVTDIVSNDFEIVPGSYDNNIPKPVVNGNTLTWTFNELKNSTLNFTYKIRPVSKTKTGKLPISLTTSNISYKDYAGATRTKAIPVVSVDVKLPAPIVTSVTEPSGPPAGGQTVTIKGKNFVQGATVTFGSTLAKNVVVVSDSEITVTAPAGAQGTVDVAVRNPDGQNAKGSYQYIIDPIVTAITPPNGPLAGSNIVTIDGNYFMKGVTVLFGDKAGSVSVFSVAQLKVVVPVGAQAGPVDVKITNPDGTSVTVSGGYTYDAAPSTDPEITSVSPNSGLVTGGNTIYINGKNFKSGMKAVVGGKDAATVYVTNAQLRLTVPAADQPGTVDVAVRDLDGKLFVKEQSYTYNPIVYPTPTVTSIAPVSGPLAGGNTVYIYGTNFVNGVSKVFIGSKEVTAVYVNSTTLRFTMPAGDAAGKVDVKVANTDQEAVLPQAYEYIAPVISQVKITDISPNTSTVSGGIIAYINGENFMSGATVTLGGTNASTAYVNATQLRITVPAATAPGLVDLTVTNKDGGTATLTGGFEYTPVLPQITGVSPGNASRAGGALIYVNGTNFNTSAIVSINGVNATTAYVSTQQLRVTVPASSTVGTVPLVVTLSNGQTASTTFVYDDLPTTPPPTLTSLTPTSAKVGATIYIYGKDFKNKPKVFFGSVEATSVTYVNTTTVRVVVPAGNTGTVEVKVVNPDTQESNTLTFTYN
ncbi:IPT/TIG domain-containing protein [Paenibacillus sp. PR3]|uniref:IPT/TIG domain-containing protein n=1 Tax=Paenibacillus terricola TaxID=2763503 RepID=A0ABR8MZ26_9BACL|nr:IPT/TIG domain-containing protein [Paenibacillus terricola]MBD3920830.1 IPT/TIG domain-containing protein [Paenibacillus terricola]